MKLYFAGADSGEFHKILKSVGVKRILVSFHSLSSVVKSGRMNIHDYYQNAELFLDSGAYSAFTKGVKIDIQDYIRFIKRHGVELYANLDDIKSHNKTLLNQKEMEKAGLNPLPVWHIYEPHSVLKWYVENYDYVALGHEHGLKKISKNHYYSGSLLPMNFKEINEKQGYLIIDINKKAKILNIEEISTSKLLKRTFEIIPIHPSPQHTSADLEALINKELNQFISDDGFDPRTAARLKFNFMGEITIEKNWRINDMMLRIRRDCFSQPDKFNILQIIWKIIDMSESFEDDISAGRIQEYILEKPDEEFKTFVNEKLNEEQSNYNVDKLTQIGMRALKKALSTIEREKEV